MQYGLGSGIHFAHAGGRFIFLDSTRNRYFCLAPKAEAEFERFVEGWIPDQGASIVQAHIVVPSEKSFIVPELPPIPTSSLLDGPLKARAVDVAALVVRYTYMKLQIAAFPESTIAKMVPEVNHAAQIFEDWPILQSTAGAYEAASKITAVHDQCLAWGLTLRKFLRNRSQPVSCIVGVSTRPFRAHCWVQTRNALVNDRYDYVRNFTPILSL